MKRRLLWFISGLAATLGVINGATLPEGFTDEVIVRNINAATCLTVAPDGRVFYAEQTGAIRVVKDGVLLEKPAIDLSGNIDDYWERGLIGMTLHPDFPRTPYLFVVYVAKEPYTHHVVSRFTVVGNRLDAKSERVLLKGDDQSTLGGNVPAGHQGGPICFGSHGNLYIGIGEQTAGEPSQSLDTLQGKILRIRPDGGIPEDNPFVDKTEGKYRAIYAIGIRNPFGLAVDPESGRLLETDVGASSFEEVNEILPGHHYGWPDAEGMPDDTRFTNPLHAYPPAIGRSICGGMFYPMGGSFPAKWHGKFFFVDWANHWIKAIDLQRPETLIPFGEGFDHPVGIAAAPDGSLYVLNRGTRWRDGDKFQENSGSLVRIRLAEEVGLAERAPAFPSKLSQTDVFDDVTTFRIAPGFHDYRLNAPLWRPGVQARRWVRIPPGQAIRMAPEGPWHFPEGTVIVQHFDTLDGRRHETQIYWAGGDDRYRAAAYRWRANGQEASLVEHTEIIPLPGNSGLQWLSPGTDTRFDPAMSLAGFILELQGRQLNAGDQLSVWRERGWLEAGLTEADIDAIPRLASWRDGTASVEHRVRSYLDANCASCHRPGGPSRGAFDARFETPLAEQKLIDAPPVAGDLGIAGARLVVPGEPDKSLLYLRLKRHDAFRMPPVAVNEVPSPILPLMEEWIRGLDHAASVGASQEPAEVRLTEGAVDESAGGLPADKIETPAAVYFLEKSGAGLSSLIDHESRKGTPTEGGARSRDSGGAKSRRPNQPVRRAGLAFCADSNTLSLL